MNLVKAVYWFSQCLKDNKNEELCKKAKEAINEIILSKTSKKCHTCLKKDLELTRCSKCKSIYYCSKECQAKDWKVEGGGHKEKCVKTEVSSLDASFIAQASKVCGSCGYKKIELTACSRCLTAYYCSKECQVKDWKEGHHKEDCKKA